MSIESIYKQLIINFLLRVDSDRYSILSGLVDIDYLEDIVRDEVLPNYLNNDIFYRAGMAVYQIIDEVHRTRIVECRDISIQALTLFEELLNLSPTIRINDSEECAP